MGLSRDDLFADALTGGVLAGRDGFPILLTRRDELSPEVQAWLTARRDSVRRVYAFGGPAALTPEVVSAAVAATTPGGPAGR